MTKIGAVRCFLLPCCATSASATLSTAVTSNGRISTNLRDPLVETGQETGSKGEDSTLETDSVKSPHAPPRLSKTMVIGTIFGSRQGHVWFCVQQHRLSLKPFLLLELSIPTRPLVKEMKSNGNIRIALECSAAAYSCPLRSIPMWTLSCNGKKLGFAVKRKANDQNCSILSAVQSMTVGAGVIPPGLGLALGQPSEEVMYMRANYEHIVGGADSESFHLINPDNCPGQELSMFLLRSKKDWIFSAKLC